VKDIRPALRAFLLADPAIAAAVGDRVYPLKMPQGVDAPSIVYQRISGQGDYHMQGASGLNRPRIQVGAWAQSIDTAAANALLVKNRLSGYQGNMGSGAILVYVQAVFFDSERDFFDEQANLAGTVGDYIFNYDET